MIESEYEQSMFSMIPKSPIQSGRPSSMVVKVIQILFFIFFDEFSLNTACDANQLSDGSLWTDQINNRDHGPSTVGWLD